jgi:hypothetical protein
MRIYTNCIRHTSLRERIPHIEIIQYLGPGGDYRERHYDGQGQLHREPDEGPASIIRVGDTLHLQYRWHGLFHREREPAKLSFDLKTGFVWMQVYYRYGVIHRDPREGPALQNWVTEKECDVIAWYWHGYEYRDPREGPRSFVFSRYGNPRNKIYSEEIPPVSPPTRRWLRETYGEIKWPQPG